LFFLALSVCAAQQTAAGKLIEGGHWKRARALVEQRLGETPDDPEATFLLSQIRNACGDRAAPLELAEKAVRLNGGVARYHRQLAEVQGVMAQHAGVFQQWGLARRFRKEIDMAIELDPRDVQARRDLLEFYLLAPGLIGGDAGKAEAVAQQVAAIDVVEGFLAQARIAEFNKDNARRGALLRQAVQVRPPSYNAHLALARFYLEPGHRNDGAAEALARGALAIDSGRVAAYSVLAAIYAGREDKDALTATLAAAAREVPDDATPYYRAAERLLALGRDPSTAERYLRLYLEQEPEGNQPTPADAHWKLGLALRDQGQNVTAIREWKIAVHLDPESPAASELKRAGNASAADSSNATPAGKAD
jgi:tetratricopeptide (TPR) repeat protein